MVPATVRSATKSFGYGLVGLPTTSVSHVFDAKWIPIGSARLPVATYAVTKYDTETTACSAPNAGFVN